MLWWGLVKQGINQYPDQLSRRYNRRAKAAAWTAGIPGIFGGAIGMEAIHTQPAVAMQEGAGRPEQSPQAFIDSFDKRLAKAEQLMRSSPYYSSIKEGRLSKAMHAEATIEYVGAPSKKYPGRYDWLTVAMIKGESVPLNIEVLIGSDSKTYIKRINAKFTYLFGQMGDSGELLPRSMSLLTSNSKDDPLKNTYFNVSSEGYPAPGLPAVGVKYSDDPVRVSAVYNAFLNQIQSIETRK